MPRKFGNEIRLPGTTGIDNLPISLRPLQVVFLFLVHRPHHEITINQCANCACALLSRYYLTFDLEICDQLQKQEGERRCKVAH